MPQPFDVTTHLWVKTHQSQSKPDDEHSIHLHTKTPTDKVFEINDHPQSNKVWVHNMKEISANVMQVDWLSQGLTSHPTQTSHFRDVILVNLMA